MMTKSNLQYNKKQQRLGSFSKAKKYAKNVITKICKDYKQITRLL